MPYSIYHLFKITEKFIFSFAPNALSNTCMNLKRVVKTNKEIKTKVVFRNSQLFWQLT